MTELVASVRGVGAVATAASGVPAIISSVLAVGLVDSVETGAEIFPRLVKLSPSFADASKESIVGISEAKSPKLSGLTVKPLPKSVEESEEARLSPAESVEKSPKSSASADRPLPKSEEESSSDVPSSESEEK